MPDTIPLTRAARYELDSRGVELVSARMFTAAVVRAYREKADDRTRFGLTGEGIEAEESPATHLTPNHRRILELLASGRSTEEIAIWKHFPRNDPPA